MDRDDHLHPEMDRRTRLTKSWHVSVSFLNGVGLFRFITTLVFSSPTDYPTERNQSPSLLQIPALPTLEMPSFGVPKQVAGAMAAKGGAPVKKWAVHMPRPGHALANAPVARGLTSQAFRQTRCGRFHQG